MSAVVRLGGRGGSGWSGSQGVLRLAVGGGPVVAVAVAGAPWWWAIATAVFSLVAVRRPESPALIVAMLATPLWWVTGPDVGLSSATLVAAVALVAAHLAALLAALGPAQAPLDGSLAALWAPRAVGLVAIAVVTWAGLRLLDGVAPPAGLWPAALGVVTLVVLALGVAVRR